MWYKYVHGEGSVQMGKIKLYIVVKNAPHHSRDCSFYKYWRISIVIGTQCIELICNVTVTDLTKTPK